MREQERPEELLLRSRLKDLSDPGELSVVVDVMLGGCTCVPTDVRAFLLEPLRDFRDGTMDWQKACALFHAIETDQLH